MECTHPAHMEVQLDEGEDYAPNCSGFSPLKVGNCSTCGVPINSPLYKNWTFKVYCSYSGDPIFACSQPCLDQLVQREQANSRALDICQAMSSDIFWPTMMKWSAFAKEVQEVD